MSGYIRLERLPLPCPINRLYRAINFGRFSKQVLSKQARLRRDSIIAEIHAQLGGKPQPITTAVQVQVVVYPRNKQSCDSDAYLKQLFDCLQKSGLLLDDKQISQHSVERMEPQHPGWLDVEIYPC